MTTPQNDCSGNKTSNDNCNCTTNRMASEIGRGNTGNMFCCEGSNKNIKVENIGGNIRTKQKFVSITSPDGAPQSPVDNPTPPKKHRIKVVSSEATILLHRGKATSSESSSSKPGQRIVRASIKCGCKRGVCRSLSTLYDSIGIHISPLRLTNFPPGFEKMGFKPGKADYFAMWHIDPTLRHIFRRSRTNRGIVPLKLMVMNHIGEKHYYPLSSVKPIMVQLTPMYGEEHFDRCHAEQRYYSKLMRKDSHLKQAISEIMNGKCSGSDMKLSMHQQIMYHPYSPIVQRELRTCHATQLIPLLAAGYSTPANANPNEGHHTMSYAIHSYKRGQRKLKSKYRDKVSESSQVRGVLPSCFYNRTVDRFKDDDLVTREKKGAMVLQSRLDNVVHRVSSFETSSQGCKLVMNLKKMDQVMQSIVPLCKVSATYGVSSCDDSELATRKMLWQNRVLSNPLLQGLSDASGTVVYVDTTNTLGLGQKMIFLRVGDYMNESRLTKLINLQYKTGASAIPIFVQVMCAYSHDLFRKRRESILSKVQRQDNADQRKTCQRFIPCVIDLVTKLKEGLIDYLSELPTNGHRSAAPVPRLERVGWIFWNNGTDKFMPHLATWQKEMIIWNKVQCKMRVLNENPNVLDENCMKDLVNEHWIRMRKYHYDFIMSCSQQSTDEQTNKMYCRLTKGVYDPISLLEQIKSLGGDVGVWYDCLIELLRESSMYTAKALALLQLTLKHAIDGPTTGDELLALYQVSDKKQRIADNTLAMFTQEITDFDAVGVDNHVERAISILVKEFDKNTSDADAKRFVKVIAKMLPPEVGLITNEILATFGQFLNRGDDAQQKCLKYVFNKMKKEGDILSRVLCRWETREKKH